MAEAASQRLFFALWPEPSLRSRLQQVLSLISNESGRPVEADNLHLTLAFPGRVDTTTRSCLEKAAGAIHLPGFTIRLDRFGYWKHPKVLWFGPSEVPEGLMQLAGELEEAMCLCGLRPESRPYRPHVTLLRKAQGVPRAEAPELLWSVAGFALVLSESTPEGVRYRVIRRWGLVA